MPLGSTTYHFATLDDLLIAALRQAEEVFVKVVAARGGLTDPRSDLATELTAWVREWLAGDRTDVELCISPPCTAPPCAPEPPGGPTTSPPCSATTPTG